MIVLLLQLLYAGAVMENSPSGTFVLKVAASDPDAGANGQISFSLHGNDANKFHLDHRTGTTATGRGRGPGVRCRSV